MYKEAEGKITIYPFSASRDLTEEDQPAISVYKKYLRTVFEDSRIKNIFVTGDYGVGKSSIIQTFEKEYCADPEHRFLYISLGEYRKESSEAEGSRNKQTVVAATAGSEEQPVQLQDHMEKENSESGERQDSSGSVEKDKDRQNYLERRMLLQIYSCFRKQGLPASSFRMIQENITPSAWLASILSALWLVITFILLRFDAISTLIVEVLTSEYTKQLQTQLTQQQVKSLNDVFSSTVTNYVNWIHLGFYAGAILVFAAILFVVILYLLPRWRVNAFTVKLDSLEASCENEACESYIDHYTTEIVYCLETIAEKINYTVVIEDLDRVDATIFFDIFTRLREINFMVNKRLERTNSKGKQTKHMRFVYVASDSMIGQLQHSKFADFILPVFPRLNKTTVEEILSKKIKNLNNELKEELGDNIWKVKEEEFDSQNRIIPIVAQFLSSYRLQNAVLNEYVILIRLYIKSNPNTQVDLRFIEDALALVTYKNLLPMDYSVILTGKSAVFPIYQRDKLKDTQIKEALDRLTDPSDPVLSTRCLYYAGYKKEDIMEAYRKKLERDVDRVISHDLDNRKKGYIDRDLYEALESYIKVLVKKNPDGTLATPICRNVAAIIDHYYAADTDIIQIAFAFKELFSDGIYAISVLEILAKCESVPSDWCKYIDESWNDDGDKCIYERCKGGINSLITGRSLSEKEYSRLQEGTGTEFFYNGMVRVDGEPRPVNSKRKHTSATTI